MTETQTTYKDWSFPFCPTPPEWTVDWEGIQARFQWIQAMHGTPQSPIYHAEGDVCIHTRMVAEAMTKLAAWRDLPPIERSLLFPSALLHDVGKPQCTKIENDGHITSKGHARKGELLSRQIMLTDKQLIGTPIAQREYIACLVRYHGLPLQFVDKARPERIIIEASQNVRMDHLALLAEADVRGRFCVDKQDLLERIELFREFCKELHCYEQPRLFATPHSRFVYFHSEQGDPDYTAYDDTGFEVVLMSGLPGAGKDTWIRTHFADRPVIALDQIRQELHITPEEGQGRVIQTAKERARSLMREKRSFIWNATNITRMLRQQLIDFFASYGARIRIVYLDAPFEVLLKRNAERKARIPEEVILKLLGKLEVPNITEAHIVEWHRVGS
jgi:predicted kinase